MLRGARALLPVLLLAAGAAPAQSAAPSPAPGTPPCTGRYADALAAMSAAARALESRASAAYVYCLRATAVYEHLSYGRGGKLRRQYVTKVRHGTGFAYRKRGAEWLVATNHHVVEFPEVTGDGGADLEGVPPGSRRIRQDVRIVSSEAEPDRPEQPALTVVVEDEALDMAVLASRTPLELAPYRFGRSADLKVGNAVLARGFPLGAFPAANAGRVIGVGQRDLERAWDHEDFAVDALLNLGSSGSPVLAIACDTGEPEIVGVYHAGYKSAQGLNVVIAIDGLRRLLDGLTPTLHPAPVPVSGKAPAEARAALARGPVVMPFGGRAVRVERDGDGVRFGLLDPTFPLSERVEVSIVDRGAPASGRAAELRDALWDQLGLVLRYRASDAGEDRAAPWLKDRIAARLRDREDDQVELVSAVRAGADGLAVTYGQRGPAARVTAEDSRHAASSPPVLVIGAR